MFPSQMISTGGDELNTHCYDVDQQTQQILNSTGQTLEQALDTFTQTTHGALAGLGKTPVVWEGKYCAYTYALLLITCSLRSVRNGLGLQPHPQQ